MGSVLTEIDEQITGAGAEVQPAPISAPSKFSFVTVLFSYLLPAYAVLIGLIFGNEWLGHTLHYSVNFYSPAVYIFQSPQFSFKYYGFFLLSGLLISLWAMVKIGPLWSMKAEDILLLATVCVMGGSIGARLYYVALCWPHFLAFPQEILNASLGGLSIHGCLIGIVIVLLLYARFCKLSSLKLLDLVCVVMPLAQSVWRWGNLFNSEAFGFPLSGHAFLQQIVTAENRPQPFSHYSFFQPTFLFESLWDLVLFFCLYFGLSKLLVKRPGMLACVYIGGYSVGRTLIESVRIDGITCGAMPVAVPMLVSLLCIMGALYGAYVLSAKTAYCDTVSK